MFALLIAVTQQCSDSHVYACSKYLQSWLGSLLSSKLHVCPKSVTLLHSAGAVKKCSVGSPGECNTETASLVTDPDSVVWYRGYVHQYERELCPQVKQVLQAMQVHRIVAGHNVMSNGRIKSLCGGKVNIIDVGMSRAYLGNLAVWKCTNGTAYAVHAGGKEFVLKLTDAIDLSPL